MTRFGLPPPPSGILERSNLEAMEAFLAALAAAGASPKTVKAYRAAISDFLSFIGDKRLREVT
ncbi:MAG TPA: integrase, partial [Pyrodictium sp.]|nr:integrase [Pyrodictium sp.]